jgi:4-aminobutyrate aminotransferase-like enzyme/Ser/Thr protein kinase RdoA (MazF antagonist)
MAPENLIALKAAPPSISVDDAEDLAHRVYGLTGRAIPLSGERDSNFKLTTGDDCHYVLKVIDPQADAAVVECQSLALAHLAAQAPDLPIPRVLPGKSGATVGLGMVDGVAYRVRLIEFMRGDLLANTTPDASLLGILGGTLGRLDQALRGFFHLALSQRIVWDVRQAPALLPYIDYLASPVSRDLVRKALEPLCNPPAALLALRAQAIHGDFHPGNILIDKTHAACSGILDFGDMIHAPIVLEPAVAMAEFLIQGSASRENLSAILKGYCDVQTLEGDDIEALYGLVTARIATAILVFAWRCRHDKAGAQATAESFAFAEESLGVLAAVGRESLTSEWLRLARPTRSKRALMGRRRRLLGSHAELSYGNPLHLVRGEGVWVFDADGRRFLDVYNNVPHVGHANPVVVNAIAIQLSRIASNTRYLDERILDYAERLTATLPVGLDACLFVNSGSEANDIAWQIAQSQTGNAGALVMANAYHGITQSLIALSPEYRSDDRRSNAPHVEFLAAPPGPRELAILNADRLSALAAQDAARALASLKGRGVGLAAFMLDSAFTSNGVYDPPPAWIAPVATAVRAAGGLIIADEVQFGLGRSGSHMWGFERRGYTPDIVTLGKPVGNGYPLGAIITRTEILDKFQEQSNFFSTFGGNPVAAAAGLAVLDVIERNQLMDNADRTGTYFRERLQHVARVHQTLGEVRGCGLLLGVDVVGAGGAPAPQRARAIVNDLRERGILIGYGGPHGHALKLRPPMVFTHEHVDHAIDILSKVLAATTLGDT